MQYTKHKILHILLVSKQKTKYNNIELHNYIIHSNNHKNIILFNKCHYTNKLCEYPSIMSDILLWAGTRAHFSCLKTTLHCSNC